MSDELVKPEEAEIYKWMVIENICTLLVTATIVSAGFYFGLGTGSLFGLFVLLNINYVKSESE